MKIYTVGATKASFRVLNVEPVPGFGVRFTITVINELHFAACIVTPFLSGANDGSLLNDKHFSMPYVWVVRNLDAHSESDPISLIVPVSIIEPGDWLLRDLNWSNCFYNAYAAPLNHFADGIYGYGAPNYINDDSAHSYKTTSDDDIAFLLACYLPNGDKVYKSTFDHWATSESKNRSLITIPAYKAPGAEVQHVIDPIDLYRIYLVLDNKVSFVGLFNWTAEYRISQNPDVWEQRSGAEVLTLGVQEAVARYGRYMTLPVNAGRPIFAPYFNKWPTVFESWPGGDIYELSSYLVETYLMPQFDFSYWRNFQYEVVRPPYLIANTAWQYTSTPITEVGNTTIVATLIKEYNSAETVDVVLIGA